MLMNRGVAGLGIADDPVDLRWPVTPAREVAMAAWNSGRAGVRAGRRGPEEDDDRLSPGAELLVEAFGDGGRFGVASSQPPALSAPGSGGERRQARARTMARMATGRRKR